MTQTVDVSDVKLSNMKQIALNVVLRGISIMCHGYYTSV